MRTRDLSPLTKLQNLEELDCEGILRSTTLLPLAASFKVSGAQVTHKISTN